MKDSVLSRMEQWTYSTSVNVHGCAEINCTWTLKTDSKRNTVHYKCTRCPKTFSHHSISCITMHSLKWNPILNFISNCAGSVSGKKEVMRKHLRRQQLILIWQQLVMFDIKCIGSIVPVQFWVPLLFYVSHSCLCKLKKSVLCITLLRSLAVNLLGLTHAERKWSQSAGLHERTHCNHSITHSHTHTSEMRRGQTRHSQCLIEYVFSQGIELYSKLALWSRWQLPPCRDRNNTVATWTPHDHIRQCHALISTMSCRNHLKRRPTKGAHSGWPVFFVVFFIFSSFFKTWDGHVTRV